MKDLLPLGSVITLKNGDKRILIIGRLQQSVKTNEVFDYAAVLWPEGYIDKNHVYLFNHEDIQTLYHIGLQDTNEFQFRYVLEEEYEKTRTR